MSHKGTPVSSETPKGLGACVGFSALNAVNRATYNYQTERIH